MASFSNWHPRVIDIFLERKQILVMVFFIAFSLFSHFIDRSRQWECCSEQKWSPIKKAISDGPNEFPVFGRVEINQQQSKRDSPIWLGFPWSCFHCWFSKVTIADFCRISSSFNSTLLNGCDLHFMSIYKCYIYCSIGYKSKLHPVCVCGASGTEEKVASLPHRSSSLTPTRGSERIGKTGGDHLVSSRHIRFDSSTLLWHRSINHGPSRRP